MIKLMPKQVLFKIARNTAFASLQPFRSIKYTSSMSTPIIHRISDFLSEPELPCTKHKAQSTKLINLF